MELTDIARITHEANKALCEILGDYSQVPWGMSPNWQQRSAVQGVQDIQSGKITSPEGSHEGWIEHKTAEGWVYGPEKDPGNKIHPCLVPFDDLPEGQQLKDHLFFAIASALIKEL